MDNDEKNFVVQLLKNNGFDDVDDNIAQDLLIVLQDKTLGNKVATAINQREQGHFDQSVTAFTKDEKKREREGENKCREKDKWEEG